MEESVKLLEPTLEKDLSLQNAKKKIKDPRTAQSTVYTLFAKYIKIIKGLDDCYDQMVQPQKRPLVRRLLEMCIGRLLELKNELVNMETSDYSYSDNVLVELKMSPLDAEVPLPRSFVHDQEGELARRKQLMADIFERMNNPPSEAIQEESAGDMLTGSKVPLESDHQVKPTEQPPIEKKSESPVGEGEEGADKVEGAEDADKVEGEEDADKVVIAEKTEEEKREEAEKELLAKLRATLPPPVIEVTPQQRRELRASKEKARADVREALAKAKEDEWREAIKSEARIIQIAERARHGRYQFAVGKVIAELRRETLRRQEGKPKTETKITPEQQVEAVIKMQHAWLKHRSREKMRKYELRRMMMLGMCIPSWSSTKNVERVEEVRRLRYETQEDNLDDFLEDERKTYDRYVKLKAPWLREDYVDEIREWFVEWYTKAKCFPEYPKEEDGGSILVVNKMVKTPEEFMVEQEEERRKAELKKLKPDKPKEKPKKKTPQQIKEEKAKEKEKEMKRKEDEKRRLEQEELDNPGFRMKDSLFLSGLEEANTSYKDAWGDRNEDDNPLQKHYMDIVQTEKLHVVEVEVRKAVDELMRLELERLKQALKKDIAKRKGKKGKGGGGGKKKKKKGKGKGKKGPKDPTGDKTTDELFEELYRNDIIKQYPEVKLSSYIGEHNYNAFDLLRREIRPKQSLGDVRNLIALYCILPFGSLVVHQLAPLIKSVCIMGPKGCGKSFLANAICSALGAVMFDLSAANLKGKYEGKDGLKMLIHLITKMSRILQPSVILVDGAEKMFYKKVPKEDRKLEPKRLKGQLPKIIKDITPDDLVYVLGLTSQPWAASPRQLVKAYNKCIVIPNPDYGTLSHVWEKFLMKYHAVNRLFDVTSLSKVTIGYSIGTIEQAIKQIMTDRRILSQVYDPLKPEEILEVLLGLPRTSPEDELKYLNWYNKFTPLGKKLTKVLEEQAILKAFLEKTKKK